jgi:hypothetical protein
MAILSSTACKICGRRACTSPRHQAAENGLRVHGGTKRGLPLSVYTTSAGETLRLNEPDARRLGLIPDEAREPAAPIIEDAAVGTPDGRVGEVLAWAGDDPERIRQALEAERAGRARVSLIAELERRLS